MSETELTLLFIAVLVAMGFLGYAMLWMSKRNEQK